MAEPAAVARSPIVRRATPGLAAVAATDPLELADWTAMGKVLVRAAPAGDLARWLAVPRGRAAPGEGGVLVARLAPDEWLLLGPPGCAPPVVARLESVPDDGLVSVVDATSARAVLRLTGRRAADVLAKLCPVDAGPAPDGTAVRSTVAGVVTEVIRDDRSGGVGRSYLLACDWSFGQYLHDTVVDAGAEFGLAVAAGLEWEP